MYLRVKGKSKFSLHCVYLLKQNGLYVKPKVLLEGKHLSMCLLFLFIKVQMLTMNFKKVIAFGQSEYIRCCLQREMNMVKHTCRLLHVSV